MAKSRAKRIEDIEAIIKTGNGNGGGVLTTKKYNELKKANELTGKYLVTPGSLTVEQFEKEVVNWEINLPAILEQMREAIQ